MDREQVIAELEYITSQAAESMPQSERTARTIAAIKAAMVIAGQRIDELKAFIAEFAEHDFAPEPMGRNHHDEEPDPLTDAGMVWAFQEDAKEILKGDDK